MNNTHKRSGCPAEEQLIYLGRKSVRHETEMQHRGKGERNFSSNLVISKNLSAHMITFVSPHPRTSKPSNVERKPRLWAFDGLKLFLRNENGLGFVQGRVRSFVVAASGSGIGFDPGSDLNLWCELRAFTMHFSFPVCKMEMIILTFSKGLATFAIVRANGYHFYCCCSYFYKKASSHWGYQWQFCHWLQWKKYWTLNYQLCVTTNSRTEEESITLFSLKTSYFSRH